MRSTFSGLNTLVRGLYAQQVSLDTVSHNISNASADGYSRQRVNLSTSLPDALATGNGTVQVGTGVAIESVTRARDTFVDQQFWKENTSLGYGLTAQDIMGKVEGIINSNTDTGIQSTLNNFWKSWQTLAINSSNASAQTAVRQRGAEVVDTIRHAVDQLKGMVSDVNATLTTKVEQINQIASEILNLNKQISNIEVGGRDNANDLRDRRDQLVDRLSQLTNVSVYEDQNHNYTIQVSNITLVNGTSYTRLATQSSVDPDYGFEVKNVIVAGSNPPQGVRFTNGQMFALQEANTTMAQSYLGKLSTVSQYLLQEFNAVHRAGFGSDNSTGTNFFGDASVNYAASPLASKGGWLDALKVNPVLYGADGLNKIAVKTSATTPTPPANQTIAVVQSNASGGAGTVSGAYLPPDGKYHTFIVKIAGVDASGHVTGIQYSLDGANYTATISEAPVGSGTFALQYGLSIKIADSVKNSATNPDTYRFSVPQGNASGDNAINLANALKQPTNPATSVLHGASLDDFYGTMVANLGIEVQNTKHLADNQQTLVNQITSWRESVAGVNVDEEMSNMIRFQKGYNAAARVVSAIDEMLDKLINGTGVVGR